jgi:hypothetical protein
VRIIFQPVKTASSHTRINASIFCWHIRREPDLFLTLQHSHAPSPVLNKTIREKAVHLYQVCYQFSDPGVRNRELRGILQTASYLKVKDIFVITFNEEETIEMNGFIVKVLPAWKWFFVS